MHTCINICLKGILLLVDFLKDVLESTIVSLQDSVFRTHVQGPFLHNGILETGVGKSSDALKHTHITLNYLLTYDLSTFSCQWIRKGKNIKQHCSFLINHFVNLILTSSVLYMAMEHPPPFLNSNTVVLCSLPPSGVKIISSLPFPGITMSVALY